MADGPPKRRWQRNREALQGDCEADLVALAGGLASQEALEMKVVFDMETGDPDDVLTLLLLASHPKVQLCAVTITPGSLDQISLVLWILQELQLEVRVGAQEWPKNAEKKCIKGKFYDSFGRVPEESIKGLERGSEGEKWMKVDESGWEWMRVDESGRSWKVVHAWKGFLKLPVKGKPIENPKAPNDSMETAAQVLVDCCDQNTTLLTGGPLHNLGHALEMPAFNLGRWVAQGGFAGEGVVPRELQMEKLDRKFAGKQTCQTWNFGGNKHAAEAALASNTISRKVLVSKNVCHRVAFYDGRFHQAFLQALEHSEAKSTRAIALKLLLWHFAALCSAMEKYQRGDGKKLHDPLAMAAMVDEAVCNFREVHVFNDRQGWGSVLQAGTNTWISIDYDDERFRQIVTGAPT
eukprot:Skav232256  [mRNA]  locus=scaffold273:154037:159511:- [translate_table: standard]